MENGGVDIGRDWEWRAGLFHGEWRSGHWERLGMEGWTTVYSNVNKRDSCLFFILYFRNYYVYLAPVVRIVNM
jgi:hypothetical protein